MNAIAKYWYFQYLDAWKPFPFFKRKKHENRYNHLPDFVGPGLHGLRTKHPSSFPAHAAHGPEFTAREIRRRHVSDALDDARWRFPIGGRPVGPVRRNRTP